jgi:hypothetical protein
LGIGEYGRGIGADQDKGAVTERDLAVVAGEHVQADGDDGPYGNGGQLRGAEGAHRKRHVADDHEDGDDGNGDAPARRQDGRIADEDAYEGGQDEELVELLDSRKHVTLSARRGGRKGL